MKNISYTEMPKDWALCTADNCPQADDCLRHICYMELPQDIEEHQCVLPQVCSRDGRCRKFVSTKPVELAWGMKTLLANIRPEDRPRVRASLIGLFGDRRRYYRFREGRWVISPAMQEAIAQHLRSHGYTAPPHFDRVVQSIYFPGRTDYVFPRAASDV